MLIEKNESSESQLDEKEELVVYFGQTVLRLLMIKEAVLC